MHSELGPFLVPIAGCAVAVVAIVTGTWSQANVRRVKAEERLAMIARGVPMAEIERLSATADVPKDPLRSLGRSRVAAVTLTFLGIGMILMGIALEMILGVREVLACSAAGLIPLAIGIGFFVDYDLQKRELSRFGLEVGADLPTGDRRG